ncbi:MAG: hypothetical protein MRY74_08505 [Neomegalonema sp.]|nr:hypothetical protein [Neomegalonema sp.]
MMFRRAVAATCVAACTLLCVGLTPASANPALAPFIRLAITGVNSIAAYKKRSDDQATFAEFRAHFKAVSAGIDDVSKKLGDVETTLLSAVEAVHEKAFAIKAYGVTRAIRPLIDRGLSPDFKEFNPDDLSRWRALRKDLSLLVYEAERISGEFESGLYLSASLPDMITTLIAMRKVDQRRGYPDGTYYRPVAETLMKVGEASLAAKAPLMKMRGDIERALEKLFAENDPVHRAFGKIYKKPNIAADSFDLTMRGYDQARFKGKPSPAFRCPVSYVEVLITKRMMKTGSSYPYYHDRYFNCPSFVSCELSCDYLHRSFVQVRRRFRVKSTETLKRRMARYERGGSAYALLDAASRATLRPRSKDFALPPFRSLIVGLRVYKLKGRILRQRIGDYNFVAPEKLVSSATFGRVRSPYSVGGMPPTRWTGVYSPFGDVSDPAQILTIIQTLHDKLEQVAVETRSLDPTFKRYVQLDRLVKWAEKMDARSKVGAVYSAALMQAVETRSRFSAVRQHRVRISRRWNAQFARRQLGSMAKWRAWVRILPDLRQIPVAQAAFKAGKKDWFGQHNPQPDFLYYFEIPQRYKGKKPIYTFGASNNGVVLDFKLRLDALLGKVRTLEEKWVVADVSVRMLAASLDALKSFEKKLK